VIHRYPCRYRSYITWIRCVTACYYSFYGEESSAGSSLYLSSLEWLHLLLSVVPLESLRLLSWSCDLLYLLWSLGRSTLFTVSTLLGLVYLLVYLLCSGSFVYRYIAYGKCWLYRYLANRYRSCLALGLVYCHLHLLLHLQWSLPVEGSLLDHPLLLTFTVVCPTGIVAVTTSP
jgi:hypothetical protein